MGIKDTEEYSGEELLEMMFRITIFFGTIFVILSLLGSWHSKNLNAETCIPICKANNMELVDSTDGSNCFCVNENNEQTMFTYQWGQNQ